MKRKSVTRLLAAAMTMTVLAAGMTGCGSEKKESGDTPVDADEQTPAADTKQDTEQPAADAEADVEEENGYTVLTDADGNVYDLGGMEIIIRNWWSPEEPEEPTNAYEEAVAEWRDWCMETYNFKIRELGISSYESAPEDFVNYATTGGDENYIFVLRSDGTLVSAMYSGLMTDLATLDCLDFSEKKWSGGVDELFSIGDSKYAMYALTPEPRVGTYFNKRLLEEAGIDPEELYKWQENGEWTFDKCREVMGQVQRDIDNDGVIDIYGTSNDKEAFFSESIFSNGGQLVSKGADGKYVLEVDSEKTLAGLNWAQELLDDFDLVKPEDANWDYYKQAFLNGDAVFCFDRAYMAGQDFKDMEDDFGFICYPKGPGASDYTNVWSNNPVVIPACYDEQKAWNIAFAYNLYTAEIPGYEDYEGWKAGYYNNFRDTESVDLTLARMVENGVVNYADVIPNLAQGEDFIWKLNEEMTPAQVAEEIKNAWQSYIDDANSK